MASRKLRQPGTFWRNFINEKGHASMKNDGLGANLSDEEAEADYAKLWDTHQLTQAQLRAYRLDNAALLDQRDSAWAQIRRHKEELTVTRQLLSSVLLAYHSAALGEPQECYCKLCRDVRTQIPALGWPKP